MYRVKSDVNHERREVDEHFAVQFERRHLIADGLYRLWRRLSDCQSNLLKDPLDILWGGLDVLVDRLELLPFVIHTIHQATLRRAFTPSRPASTRSCQRSVPAGTVGPS